MLCVGQAIIFAAPFLSQAIQNTMTATPIVEVLSDRAALVARAADLVEGKIKEAAAERGFCSLALAGGSTPRPLYEELSRRSLPLAQLHLFFGDERYVAPDHRDSNYRMVRQAWLEPAGFPVANIHAMDTNAAEPVEAAKAHALMLKRIFQVESEVPPQFDIVLLGMGDDGHTASLFPGTDALAVSDRWVTVGYKGDDPRLTLTLPVLNRARSVMFLVSGANKQTALSHVFSETSAGTDYPAKLIRPEGELRWLLDVDAGKNF